VGNKSDRKGFANAVLDMQASRTEAEDATQASMEIARLLSLAEKASDLDRREMQHSVKTGAVAVVLDPLSPAPLARPMCSEDCRDFRGCAAVTAVQRHCTSATLAQGNTKNSPGPGRDVLFSGAKVVSPVTTHAESIKFAMLSSGERWKLASCMSSPGRGSGLLHTDQAPCFTDPKELA
jgi:hypothetical protein